MWIHEARGFPEAWLEVPEGYSAGRAAPWHDGPGNRTGETTMGASSETGGARNPPDHTIHAAVEVSRKSWVVGVRAPDTGRIETHTVAAADADALTGLLDRARETLERRRGFRPRVLCAYEAGYEGFWLARRLARHGVEAVVLDAASLPVTRAAKRIKTDRVDAANMVRALAAFDGGDPRAANTIRIPDVEEEDRRRLMRERRRLVKQRTMLTNSVRGLLMLHGVFGLNPRTKDFDARLDAARTGYGTPLPPRVHAEIRRAKALLAVVEGQVAEVEAERDRLVERAKAGCGSGPDGGGGPCGEMIARLVGLKGVGANDATVLAHEVFSRQFANRRQLASWAGLAPAPWASGGTARSQGIDKTGPPWVRAHLVQLSWRWLRHQPESALSQWFRTRTGRTGERMRRVFVVALARKLLVALWRYATNGVVPRGARLA